jgi:hypothetical protein
MTADREQFKSSYGAFAARELARARDRAQPRATRRARRPARRGEPGGSTARSGGSPVAVKGTASVTRAAPVPARIRLLFARGGRR